MKIAIIGASKNRDKYSNKAVRAYKKNHHVVFPVNPNEREIEGLTCYNSVINIPLEIDVASLYLPPALGIKVVPEIIKKEIPRVIINPGAESKEIVDMLKKNKIKVELKCSIQDIGENPNKF